jgi:predicted CopG family antitoxin
MSLEATIKISFETRDALKTLGRKGESYDTVIRRLIEKEKA